MISDGIRGTPARTVNKAQGTMTSGIIRKRNYDCVALARLLELRQSGLTTTEIANAIGYEGSEKAKKQAIIYTFKVLLAAGVEVGKGRTAGKRGIGRKFKAKPPVGSGSQLADATNKEPSP